MNQAILTISPALGASIPLLVDSAVKGTALLVLAAVVAMILKRDSAATRHLVWLLAIVAMLALPVLSALLPEWRVLPEWAGVRPQDLRVATSLPAAARPADRGVEMPRIATPAEVGQPSVTAPQPAAPLPDPGPAPPAEETRPESPVVSRNWGRALPLVWALGFSGLILRLLVARLLLWKLERQGTVICSSSLPAKASDDPIVTALDAVASQLGIRGPVGLMIHPGKPIPVVWGIFRARLLLPAEVRHWSEDQLRSVLLHELAHIKRRDTTALLLTQIACALHWFNPLVWFAAWRMGVERERACDDLVLASGVRPSAYAGHLIELVTGPSAARWTPSVGLAMARKSSLEGRLVAVLSDKLNRRGVSLALAAIALAVAAGIAVPVAMLRAADETPGAPVQNEPQESNDGANLKPGIEERLQWGKPVNGLRAALIRPQALGEPDAGEHFDLRLVVQNVSEMPVRFNTAFQAPKNPYVRVREHGETLFGIIDSKPIRVDYTLNPRQVAVTRLMSQRDPGPSITSDNPRLTFLVALTVQNAPAGTWTGRLETAETAALFTSFGLMPKHKDAQALFTVWNDEARLNGKIPGALIGLLAEGVKTFAKSTPARESIPQLLKILSRMDSTHDWSGQDSLAILDELAAVQGSPIRMVLAEELERTLHNGVPLPPGLASAPWGEALPNGLRMAWLFEPRAAAYRLGTPLQSRILIHNAGNRMVVFRTSTLHQGKHKATDARGADIKVASLPLKTAGRLVTFQLAPGEFVEVNGAGLGLGGNADDWQNTGVGSWLEAKASDDVTVTTAPVSLFDRTENGQPGGEPRWWLDFIAMRLSRRLPIPAETAERERLLYRVAIEFLRTPLEEEENTAFVADREPTALDSVARRLARRADITPFSGSLQSAPTRFRVLSAAPGAANKPRTATNPGRYGLGDNAVLVVSRRPLGERIANDASIQFSASTDTDGVNPAVGVIGVYEIKLPDGFDTWAAAWVRGGSVLWLETKDGVRSIDFSTPANIKEAATQSDKVPVDIREALRRALAMPAAKASPAGGGRPASPPASAKP